MIDQFGAIVDRPDFDAGRQRGFDLFQFLFQSPRDLMAVFAHQHEAEPEHRFTVAVCRDGSLSDFVADLHFGDIANADRYAVASGHDDVLDLLDVDRAALSVDEQHAAHVADVASADVAVVGSQGRDHFVEGQLVTDEPLRIDPHLKLLFVAAPTVNLGDSGHAAQLRLHNPVVNRSQLSQFLHADFVRQFREVDPRFGQHIVEHFAEARGDRPHLRPLNPNRQFD